MSITAPQQSTAADARHQSVPASVREISRRLEPVTSDTFGGLAAASAHRLRSCRS
jgi:hypothetical protein